MTFVKVKRISPSCKPRMHVTVSVSLLACMRPVIRMHARDYDCSAAHGAQWQEQELIFGRLLQHGNCMSLCTKMRKQSSADCRRGRRSLSEQSVPGPQQFSGSNRKRRDPGKYFWGGVRSREIRKARWIFKNAIAARQCIYF